tara:strand:+ start:4674 stop:5720 length:1047 start_codon:yes stop_codon:yes gene_type:complete
MTKVVDYKILYEKYKKKYNTLKTQAAGGNKDINWNDPFLSCVGDECRRLPVSRSRQIPNPATFYPQNNNIPNTTQSVPQNVPQEVQNVYSNMKEWYNGVNKESSDSTADQIFIHYKEELANQNYVPIVTPEGRLSLAIRLGNGPFDPYEGLNPRPKFRGGDRFLNISANKTGTVKYLRQMYGYSIMSGYTYMVEYDDGSHQFRDHNAEENNMRSISGQRETIPSIFSQPSPVQRVNIPSPGSRGPRVNVPSPGPRVNVPSPGSRGPRGPRVTVPSPGPRVTVPSSGPRVTVPVPYNPSYQQPSNPFPPPQYNPFAQPQYQYQQNPQQAQFQQNSLGNQYGIPFNNRLK